VSSPATVCFYINYFSSYTGGPQVVRSLVQRLDRERFRPFVITNCLSPLTEDLTQQGIECEILPQVGSLGETAGVSVETRTKRLLNSVRGLAYNYEIYRVLRNQNASIVWARNIKGVLLTGFAARWLKIPVIWDIGMEKTSVGAIGRLHRLGFHLADTVVTEGDCVAPSVFPKEVCKRYENKIRVIKSGIPADRVDQICRLKLKNVRDAPADCLTIINIGSICERKNQRLLLEAVLPLMKERHDLRLQLVGPVVEESYNNALKAMVGEAQLHSRVEFLGWRSDVLELLVGSDIFALTSLVEGVPYSVLEAMYAKVPIVSTNCGGVPDVIEDGTTGFLAKDFEPETFRKGLRRLLGDAALRNQFGDAAFRYVNRHHTAEAWSRSYMELFTQILECSWREH